MKFFRPIEAFATSTRFQRGRPFPHVVIDDLCVESSLRQLTSKFPKIEDTEWYVYSNPLEKKFAMNDLSRLDPCFAEFFTEGNSPEFVEQLRKLSGLEDLIADPTLNGGGLHQIVRDGKLDVHEDYNVHLGLMAWRKLNVIVYLNDEWEESWGGHLELWDRDMTECVRKVAPMLNRTVIFRTDCGSNHGHPEPLTCPKNVSRKSLALYFYVPMTDEEKNSYEYSSTRFKRRPNDLEDPEIEKMRRIRNMGRLEDKKS